MDHVRRTALPRQLETLPGAVAFVQLRNTVKGWKAGVLPIDRSPSRDMAATRHQVS